MEPKTKDNRKYICEFMGLPYKLSVVHFVDLQKCKFNGLYLFHIKR